MHMLVLGLRYLYMCISLQNEFVSICNQSSTLNKEVRKTHKANIYTVNEES